MVYQIEETEGIELIVVDNNSIDKTPGILASYASKFKCFKPAIETRIGLSYARNKGIEMASSNWGRFLDDDAKAAPDLIERTLWVVDNFDFDCFGGMYYAWFKFGCPKWLPKQYGTKIKLLEEIGYLYEPSLSGGLMAVKKEVLLEVGGFSTKLGMSQNVGYGEDSELQVRLLKEGFKLGFDPLLYINHCVLPYKFSMKWQLRAALAKGRDAVILSDKRDNYLSSVLSECFMIIFIRLPYALFRLVVKKNFYWQNALISISTRLLNRIGAYRYSIKKKKGY